jgi:hypothetical protein
MLKESYFCHFVNVGVSVGTKLAMLRITKLLDHGSKILHKMPDDVNTTETKIGKNWSGRRHEMNHKILAYRQTRARQNTDTTLQWWVCTIRILEKNITRCSFKTLPFCYRRHVKSMSSDIMHAMPLQHMFALCMCKLQSLFSAWTFLAAEKITQMSRVHLKIHESTTNRLNYLLSGRHHDIRHNNKNATPSKTTSSVNAEWYCYSECRYAEYYYAECQGAYRTYLLYKLECCVKIH